jgi:hypothetical protein
LTNGVGAVKKRPNKLGQAPVYGMAASLPFLGMVIDMLKRYMDMLYGV